MVDILTFLHLAAAIVWMGGMTFMLFALRPAALLALEAQPRARLMVQVWQRFFRLVLGAIVVLLATGGHLFGSGMKAAGGHAPLGWTVMAVLGVVMVLAFGHINFAGFAKFKRAVAAAEWPLAAKAAGQIHTLVVLNFVLGWVAIAAIKLLH
ncbi:MAG: hypothetical protein ABIP34_16825 [Rhodoferax sp.]|uniref:hypothetical protein n=1 Tax=Rhodoferax sp. TaxID=50421 RepID=UPI003263A77E